MNSENTPSPEKHLRGDIPLLADLQRHVDEIGHTEVGENIRSAIEVIKHLAAQSKQANVVPVSSPSGDTCDGWRASYITYSRYPYSVEWISDAWYLRFHHGNGAQSTVSKHRDPFSAMRSAPAPQTRAVGNDILDARSDLGEAS